MGAKTIQQGKNSPFNKWYWDRCSLMAEWLECLAFTAVAQVQSLVGELRSHKP